MPVLRALNKDEFRRGPIPEEALRYFAAKKLKVSMDYREVWKQEHNLAFTIAKESSLAVLDTVKEGIERALEQGESFQTFKKGLRQTLESAGWTGLGAQKPTRLKLVYDTNVRQARAAGQWERIERTKEALPYLLYELGPSERHRPDHAALEGTLLPVDDSFWDTHMPQNGFNCKCHVSQISDYRAAKLGGPTERPETPEVEWKNTKTGKVEKVPRGTDPGFDYNPGKVRRTAEGSRSE